MKLIPIKTVNVTSTNVPAGDNQGYMFDEFLNNQTENADMIEVEIDFNNVDRVAVFNVDAYSIDFELTDNNTSSVVQSETIDLSMGDGYYKQWVVEPLYVYANATLKISIKKTGGTAKCGKVAIGLSTDIGKTQYAPDIGFVDYSIKDTDDFGRTYLNPGNWAKSPSVRTRIDRNVMDFVFADLVAVRGKVSIFECNDNDTDYESLRVYGFIENWGMTMTNDYTGAYLDINLKGVI